MKKSTRFLLGLFSSLLLSAGLLRAAQHLDPLSVNQPDLNDVPGTDSNPIATCILPCLYVPHPSLSETEVNVQR